MKNGYVQNLVAGIAAIFLCAAPGIAAPRQAPTASAAPPARPFAPKYLESIPLRFVDAAMLAKTFNADRLPAGVTRLKVDPENPKSLQVLGTADGIATLKSLVSLVDAKPKKATFQVIVERTQFGANNKRYANPVATKTLTLTHNVATKFAVKDAQGETIAVSLTARMPDDPAKRTLLATLGWMSKEENTVGLEAYLPLPTGKERTCVVGVTFAGESKFIAALGAGKIPKKWQGRQVAYILYAKPLKAPQ